MYVRLDGFIRVGTGETTDEPIQDSNPAYDLVRRQPGNVGKNQQQKPDQGKELVKVFEIKSWKTLKI